MILVQTVKLLINQDADMKSVNYHLKKPPATLARPSPNP